MSVARRLYGLRKNGSESDRTSVNDKLHSSLFNDSPKDYVVSSSPKIFSAIHPDDITDNFYISDKELEAYAQGFLDVATQENIQELLLDKEVEDEGLSNVALDDSDIKLSLNPYMINGLQIVVNQPIQKEDISLIIMVLI